MTEPVLDSDLPPAPGGQRALRILAKTVHRQLKATGCSRTEMVAFANMLLDLISDDMRGDDPRS
jgi:hypothetical protein